MNVTISHAHVRSTRAYNSNYMTSAVDDCILSLSKYSKYSKYGIKAVCYLKIHLMGFFLHKEVDSFISIQTP